MCASVRVRKTYRPLRPVGEVGTRNKSERRGKVSFSFLRGGKGFAPRTGSEGSTKAFRRREGNRGEELKGEVRKQFLISFSSLFLFPL